METESKFCVTICVLALILVGGCNFCLQIEYDHERQMAKQGYEQVRDGAEIIWKKVREHMVPKEGGE